MALAFVNSAAGSDDASNTTVATAAFNATAGNALVVGVFWVNDVTVSSIVDTAGNSYTATQARTLVFGTDYLRMYYVTNITGHASNVITVTLSGAATFKRMIVQQWSGMDNASPLDASVHTAAGSQTVTHTSNTFSTDTADEVLICFAGWNGGTSSGYTAGSGYTINGDVADHAMEYQIVSTTQSSVSATMDGNLSQYNWSGVATFREAAAADPAGPHAFNNYYGVRVGNGMGTNERIK